MKLYFENHPLLKGVMACSGKKTNLYGSSDFMGEFFKIFSEIDEYYKEYKLNEDEELSLFKIEFYSEVAAMPKNVSIRYVLNISDGAFKRMKQDSQYRQQVMGLLKRDLNSPTMGKTDAIFTIGEDIKQYRVDSWNDRENSRGFKIGGFKQRSCLSRRRKQDYLDELLEQQYLLKRRLWLERIQEQAFENKAEYTEYLKATSRPFSLENPIL